jgi:exodeoxyribonuclease VII small subunit
MPEPDAAERPRLSTVFGRLDQILSQLDREDMDLEEQMTLYREAVRLMSAGRSILEETRAEIEILSAEADGAPRAPAE